MDRTTILCVIAMVMGVFLMCSAPYAHPLHPLDDGAPWASWVEETFHLTTCDDAQEKIIKLGNRKDELEAVLKMRDTKEMHDMIDPKIEALDQWIIDIDYWMNSRCKET